MSYSRLLIAFFCLSFIACSKQETNVEYGKKHQILFAANQDEPRELDPQLSTGSPEHNILNALFEGLVQKDTQTLAPIPGVAESWTISDDGLIYEFTLRDNARWSNGDPVTAEDFVWSWHRSLLPALASEWAQMKFVIKNAEAFYQGEISDFSLVGVHAVSPAILRVELNYPTPYFLQLLDHNSFFPVHRQTIEKFGAMDQAISQWTRPENFVGNGPFLIKEWKANDIIRTEKNPYYWGHDKVKLNGIVFFPITDQQAEVRAFKAGQVHLTMTPQLAIEKMVYYRQNEPEKIKITPVYSTYYYEFNVKHDALKDKRVRQALAMAIDRETIVSQVSKAGEIPAYSPVPFDAYGYQPKQYYSYDLEKAQSLLAAAGYPNGEGFPSIDILYNTNDNHRKIALAIQQMLKKNLNIEVTLTNQEWKVFLNSKRQLEHDLARAGWIADFLDPSNFFSLFLSYSGNNNTGWANTHYDALFEKSNYATTNEERFAYMEEANAMLADEMPVIPVFYYVDVNLVSPDVKNWNTNAMHYYRYENVYLKSSE